MAKATLENLMNEVLLVFRFRDPKRKRLGYRNRATSGAIQHLSFFAISLGLVLLLATTGHAQAKRVVVLKVDGLPYDSVDRFAAERDPQTGKSRLPWFDYIFYQNGTRLTNFYVRGMAFSANAAGAKRTLAPRFFCDRREQSDSAARNHSLSQ